jgi:hypothetical protein
VGAGGAGAGYLFIHAPLGGWAGEVMVNLEHDTNGGSQVRLAAKDDDGRDLICSFSPTL